MLHRLVLTGFGACHEFWNELMMSTKVPLYFWNSTLFFSLKHIPLLLPFPCLCLLVSEYKIKQPASLSLHGVVARRRCTFAFSQAWALHCPSTSETVQAAFFVPSASHLLRVGHDLCQCAGDAQLMSGFLSERIAPCTVVDLCVHETRWIRASYVTILGGNLLNGVSKASHGWLLCLR